MATYTININERTSAGKYLLKILQDAPFVTFKHTEKTELEKAIDEVESGKVYKAESVEKLMDIING